MIRTTPKISLALLLLPWMAASAGGAEASGDLRSLLQKPSRSKADFLPPDEAFQFAAQREPNGNVKLEWVIAPGYYLYKDRLRLDSAAKDSQLGAPQLPRGKLKHDEFFGDTEVYYEILEARVTVEPGNATRALNFSVTYQGCAEAGLCYNPIVKQVTLPIPAAPTGDTSKQIRDTQRPSSQSASSGGATSRP